MLPLLQSIQDAGSYDDLLPVLESLSREATVMASAERADAGKVQAMNRALDEARLLLNELTRREVRFRGTSRHAAARHLELEGMMKEIGTVLDHAIKKVKV